MWKIREDDVAIYNGDAQTRIFTECVEGGLYFVRYTNSAPLFMGDYDIAVFTRYSDARDYIKKLVAELNEKERF